VEQDVSWTNTIVLGESGVILRLAIYDQELRDSI
jgi:hypothetical protein